MKTREIKKYKGISIMNQNRSLKYDRKEREKKYYIRYQIM